MARFLSTLRHNASGIFVLIGVLTLVNYLLFFPSVETQASGVFLESTVKASLSPSPMMSAPPHRATERPTPKTTPKPTEQALDGFEASQELEPVSGAEIARISSDAVLELSDEVIDDIKEITSTEGAVFLNRTRFAKTGEMRKTVYTHQLLDYGESFSKYVFNESLYNPRCTSASMTVFSGPILLGRCSSLISKEFVFAWNDFPKLIPDPRYCYDLYNQYFKAALDGEAPLNQPMNLSEHFVPKEDMLLVQVPKLVPILFVWGLVFPHTVKDTMPRVMLSLPYLAANPSAKLLMEQSAVTENFLRRMGVPDSRVHWIKRRISKMGSVFRETQNIIYEATEELAFPHCLPGPLHTGVYAPEIYHALRDVMVRAPPLPLEERNLIVYVARDGGDNSKMRRIDNEAKLLSKLNHTVNSLEEEFELRNVTAPQFIKFVGKGQTMESSIDIFRRARVVLGPHGGGFYNVLFSAPGTHVLELTPDDYGKNEVSRFSTILGLNYNGFIKRGMGRTETFGDVDIEWMTSMVLHLYDSQIIQEAPALPQEYFPWEVSAIVEQKN